MKEDNQPAGDETHRPQVQLRVPSIWSHTTFDIVKKIPKCVFRLILLQCPPLNRITFGQRNKRMIQLTDVFCALFIYNWAINI